MPDTVTLLPSSLSYAASGSIGMVGCWAAVGIEMAQAITADTAAPFMRDIGVLRLLTRGDPGHETWSNSRSNWGLKFDGDAHVGRPGLPFRGSLYGLVKEFRQGARRIFFCSSVGDVEKLLSTDLAEGHNLSPHGILFPARR